MSYPLEATGLSVGYRSKGQARALLNDLNLTVSSGELICLLGANGTGKSTLLRTISKIQKPLAGQIRLSGAEINTISQIDLAKRLGVVLTERIQVGALPAYRIVELGRYAHLGWSGRLSDHDHAVVRWAIAAVGAEHLAARDSRELSDGERQRIMIARALAQEPGLLLLDEPTAFLDVPSRIALMGLLRDLARTEAIAIILSSHDLELALRMADTIWLIGPGGELHSGAPEDVVMRGQVANAFASKGVAFSPEERTFRLNASYSRRARIKGSGLGAILAAGLLEREGYKIVEADAADVLTIWVEGEEGCWQACSPRTGRTGGRSFAALAIFARQWALGQSPAASAAFDPEDIENRARTLVG